MDRPSLGTITYRSGDGKETEISKFTNDRLAKFRRNHCGFVFQQNYLNDSMSALDNVMVSGLLLTKDRKALAGRAKQLLEKVEIGEQDLNKFPAQLSGGMQQRVAVVRGVINRPEILFADEPTGALNSQNTTNVLEILSDLNSEGQSIVMVTHDLKTALRGTRVLFLRDGSVAGEYRMEPFGTDDMKARRAGLQSFLDEMGW
jgi:putative ABC transport system ATP-binding protein